MCATYIHRLLSYIQRIDLLLYVYVFVFTHTLCSLAYVNGYYSPCMGSSGVGHRRKNNSIYKKENKEAPSSYVIRRITLVYFAARDQSPFLLPNTVTKGQ